MTAWGALARYCARCPVSLERLEYDAETGTVTYMSDKAGGAGGRTSATTAVAAPKGDSSARDGHL